MSQWQPIETAPKDGAPVIISVAGFVGEAAYRAEGSHEGAWWWANEGPGDYHADSIDSRHGEPTHWMPLPDPPETAEPDMSRMGEKHIKPCRGCDALLLWAKHFKTDGTVGKTAPLVKAREGEKANICAWYEAETDQWFYGIGQGCQPGLVEYVNHFSNCPRSKDFRAAPLSEDEARQSQIK